MQMIPKRCQKNLNAVWKVKFAEYGWLPDAWEVLHLDYNIWLRNMIVVNERISEWTSVEWNCMCGNKPAGATFSQQPVGTPVDLCLSTWIARSSPLFRKKMAPGSCTLVSFLLRSFAKNEKWKKITQILKYLFEVWSWVQTSERNARFGDICFSKFIEFWVKVSFILEEFAPKRA